MLLIRVVNTIVFGKGLGSELKMSSRKYRYALYGLLIAVVYCALLFLLHYLVSSGTPAQLLRDFPSAAIVVALSLPVCVLTGYLLGAEKDNRESTKSIAEQQQERLEVADSITSILSQSEEARRMAGIAVQEMKHPLTSIIGYTMTLHEYWDKLDEDSKREFISFIKVSSSRLEGIANDLMRIMELARYSPTSQDVNLNPQDIITEVCSVLDEIYAERGVKIALRFLDDIPSINSDPAHLFDLLYNVLDISMRCSDDEHLISLWCSHKDKKIVLHIRCTNSSMDQQQILLIKRWPPSDKEGEMATLSMEYHLAQRLTEEVGGELKLDALGKKGLSILFSFSSA
jgi:light-regulated signal transduction histidine kinase (bacteriophytochrome)